MSSIISSLATHKAILSPTPADSRTLAGARLYADILSQKTSYLGAVSSDLKEVARVVLSGMGPADAPVEKALLKAWKGLLVHADPWTRAGASKTLKQSLGWEWAALAVENHQAAALEMLLALPSAPSGSELSTHIAGLHPWAAESADEGETQRPFSVHPDLGHLTLLGLAAAQGVFDMRRLNQERANQIAAVVSALVQAGVDINAPVSSAGAHVLSLSMAKTVDVLFELGASIPAGESGIRVFQDFWKTPLMSYTDPVGVLSSMEKRLPKGAWSSCSVEPWLNASLSALKESYDRHGARNHMGRENGFLEWVKAIARLTRYAGADPTAAGPDGSTWPGRLTHQLFKGVLRTGLEDMPSKSPEWSPELWRAAAGLNLWKPGYFAGAHEAAWALGLKVCLDGENMGQAVGRRTLVEVCGGENEAAMNDLPAVLDVVAAAPTRPLIPLVTFYVKLCPSLSPAKKEWLLNAVGQRVGVISKDDQDFEKNRQEMTYGRFGKMAITLKSLLARNLEESRAALQQKEMDPALWFSAVKVAALVDPGLVLPLLAHAPVDTPAFEESVTWMEDHPGRWKGTPAFAATKALLLERALPSLAEGHRSKRQRM